MNEEINDWPEQLIYIEKSSYNSTQKRNQNSYSFKCLSVFNQCFWIDEDFNKSIWYVPHCEGLVCPFLIICLLVHRQLAEVVCRFWEALLKLYFNNVNFIFIMVMPSLINILIDNFKYKLRTILLYRAIFIKSYKIKYSPQGGKTKFFRIVLKSEKIDLKRIKY